MSGTSPETHQSKGEFTLGSEVRLRDLLENYPKARFVLRAIDAKDPNMCFVSPFQGSQSARDAIERYYGKQFSEAGLLVPKSLLVAPADDQHA